jgi:hypothetical protein
MRPIPGGRKTKNGRDIVKFLLIEEINTNHEKE